MICITFGFINSNKTFFILNSLYVCYVLSYFL